MAHMIGKITGKILIQIQGAEPIEVGTIEAPFTAEAVGSYLDVTLVDRGLAMEAQGQPTPTETPHARGW